mmetsp:Transcript_5157/g.15471  ORF Transcript_5157/g.15471 Transcript_5157/m.15471 type:complete len:120 (+) Transcript_5157:164-523(+)
MRKPTWMTVDGIQPDSRGVNLFVKVVAAAPPESAGSASEVVVGDSTAVVTLRARGKQAALCEAGRALRIQNARAVVVKGFIRLEVDKWGVLALATSDHDSIEPNASRDISGVEYELAAS